MRHICLKTAIVEPRAGLAAEILHVVIAVALGDTGMLARGLQYRSDTRFRRITILLRFTIWLRQHGIVVRGTAACQDKRDLSRQPNARS